MEGVSVSVFSDARADSTTKKHSSSGKYPMCKPREISYSGKDQNVSKNWKYVFGDQS
jgi:hypothetical protein